MKMQDAMKIINGEPRGFMVSFEWKKGGILESDHFPDKHAGEPLIETEKEAWLLAAEFAKKMRDKVVNLYVIGRDFAPVDGYRDKYIENR
jgi:hypothetical protein